MVRTEVAEVTGYSVSRQEGPILEAVEVRKGYRVQSGLARFSPVAALDGVSVRAWEGETLAIAGESGCGKSTLGRLLLGLLRPESGEVRFAGRSLDTLPEPKRRDFRRAVQMVFQNPLASFNPMLTVGASLRDGLRLRNDLRALKARNEEAERLARLVGLDASILKRYPSEVSAGQLQQASIARALATQPRMIFLDEPTSALDATGRRQIIDLLLSLQREFGLGYILVAHDFQVIASMACHIVVMYLGQIVEEGPGAQLLQRPLHPYSRALLAASRFELARPGKWRVKGEVSQLAAGYQGCRLYSRCPSAVEACQQPQNLFPVDPQHTVRCCRALELECNISKGENCTV